MMSHRGKRQALSRLDDITPVATKRRKGRASATAEEEEASPLEQRPSYSSVAHTSSDMKMSSIYNRSVTDAPAELFRKDLISAMKLPDSEPLTSDHYWVITDQWKQEWERGVQVPVKPDSLPGPVVRSVNTIVNYKKPHLEFKLPKNKYIRITKDEHFRVDEHYLSNVGIQAEKCCAYDLEDVDVVWLNILNGERALLGLSPISQDQLERIIEELEMRCWEKVHAIVKEEEGLALEFDESVICDVCRSPDSEDGNEMVFCDCCNICVHQACYGITSIPSGSWLCRTCNLGLRPECVLCPNKNGAMKSTRSGQKWAHVSCALWIPEVSIGCVERMEPITKISSIPQSRWALICVLCRERVGACIQCSVKTCKTAYHVTCAFKHGLEMRAIIDEESTTDDDNTVKLRSYCQKHSVSCKKESSSISGSASDEDVKKKQRKDMTTEEKSHARALKLQEIESEFEKHVTIKDINRKYDVDAEGLEYIYNYWVLKRRAAFNKPLIAARSEDASDLLNKNQEQVDQEKMRMFVQLRQDLERVRNLCYMVSRREKLSRTYQRLREQTFYKQAALLSDTRISLSTAEINSIKEANHGPSIYDRLYSHMNAPDLSTDFETMVLRIAGRSESELSPGHSFNGYISGKNGRRSCFNGDYGKGSSNSGFFESLSSSASDAETKSHPVTMDTESDTRSKVNNCMNKSQRKNSVENRTKNTARRRKKPSPTLVSPLSTDFTSSSEDDGESSSRKSGSKPSAQKQKKSSTTTSKPTNAKKKAAVTTENVDPVQKRFLGGRSASISPAEDEDDDESEQERKLLRTKTKSGFISKHNSASKIYSSDSDSSTSSSICRSDAEEETKPADNKQVRTKASMKEFSAAGGNAGANHRTPKERSGSNGINKSVSFLSSSSSSTASSGSKNTNITATEKRRRMDKLFNEESDEEISRKNADQDDSDNDVFLPQRKPIKTVADRSNATKSRKNETREKEVKPSVLDSISKKHVTRKDCAKDDVFSSDTSTSADKSSQNHNSSSNYDMLTLVPQRAAAKKAIKAIEHMNNGIVKPPTVFDGTEEAIKVSKGIKATTLSSKKENQHHQPTATTKTKIPADDDTSKMIGVDKRQKSSSGSLVTTSSSSAIRPTGTAPSSSVTPPTTTSSSLVSSINTSSTSHLTSSSSIISATTSTSSTVVTPAASVAAPVATKKSPTPSSSSSSYSSSSSNSSSSDSSSSGESSSSSNSSSSSGSSSSSSESEGEDDVKPNLTRPKPTPSIGVASSISTSVSQTPSLVEIGKLPSPVTRISTELDERDISSAKREIEANSNEKKGSSKISPYEDDREECKPLLSSLQDLAASNEQKSLPGNQPISLLSPVRETLNENYSHTADDHSSFHETKTAIENLTNDEQNFLSDLWGTAASVTSSSTGTSIVTSDSMAAISAANSKNSVMHMIVDDDDDEDNSSEKHSSPLLPALPSRSLFSPQLIKDIDLSSFDDMNENNNLTENSNMSLLSLSGLNFDGNFSFKESSKEDSARETKNLVEKLKQEMKRKQHPGGDKLDSMGSAPTPDVLLNHMDDDEDPEIINDQINVDKMGSDERVKKDGGIMLDSCTQQPHQQLQQESSLMSISSDNTLLLPESVPSLKMTPNMAVQAFTGSSEDAVILPKENLPMSDTLPVAWPSSERRFDDGVQSSPYTQELANAPDRWSESVVLPSRRSDCSSASVSSRSSSSSTYSEPSNQKASHNDDVGMSRLEQPLELPPHFHKSVADFLRPGTDNIFGPAPTGGALPDIYQYDEHQPPFVKSAFDPTTPIIPDNKSLFTHSGVAPQTVQQSSAPLFGASSMSSYDPVTAFSNTSSLMTNAFSQPLSVATASFTTTSQNMAIIASIISPVAPPPLHSDETPMAATPVSSDSVTFEDKSANSSTSDASCTMAPSLEKSVIEEDPPPTPQLPQLELMPSQPQPTSNQPCPEDDVYSSAEKEKENIFTNVNDVANSASSATAPAPSPASAPVSIKEAPPSVQSVVSKSPASVSASPAHLEPAVTKGRPGTRKSQRNNNKNASNRRGRGRGRGRGRSRNANCFYRELDDDIHSKLVGTVYDFDDDEDDLTSDNFTNLKAMRERRKSTDTAICDRFSTSSKDTCYSPKFASPSSQHQPPSSKRKSSVASTPDRRTSHRIQLSPLCEIGNNVRILPKDAGARGDSLLAAEPDDDDEDEVPEEEDDEEEEPAVAKKSGSCVGAAAASAKHDRRASSISSAGTATTSPTLPQPPVQASAVDQFAAVQPLLPGPVDMRTYSGDVSFDADTRLSDVECASAVKDAASESAGKNGALAQDAIPDIIDEVLSIPAAAAAVATGSGRGSAKNSPAVSASPRLAGDALKTSAAVAVANHFLASDADAMPGDTPSVVMLDDDSQSRNQLKMKIKGPYSNANYVPVTSVVSSVAIAHQQLQSASHAAIVNDVCYSGAATATLTTAASSSANLPRMRKKELLLQYCSNINESGNNVVTVTNATGGSAAAPDANAAPIKSGPSYKLPKAVASMTTIPTKEDYKAVLDAAGFIEKKKRGKDKSGALYDASDISNNNAAAPNSFATSGNVGGHGYHGVHNNKHCARSSSADRRVDAAHADAQGAEAAPNAYDNHSTKRKSRGNGASSSTAAHPKLKIKIGGASAVVVQNSVVGAGASASTVEEKNLRLRPPKKRLCEPNDMLPSPAFVEQLKRECIRYGSKIRSEFNANGASYDGEYSDADEKQSTKEESSRKKRKRSGANSSQKSSKRKKKQEKSSSRCESVSEAEVVRVITNEVGGDGAPKKLIIKFRGLNPPSSEASASGPSTSPPPPPSPAKPPKSSKRNLNHELDSVRTTKITPIRLKFSRSQQGYVSKTSCAEEESTTTAQAPAAHQPKAGDPPAASSANACPAVAHSSLLPNEVSPATKTTVAPPQSASCGPGSSADGAAAASHTSAASSATAAAAVCLSDALSKS